MKRRLSVLITLLAMTHDSRLQSARETNDDRRSVRNRRPDAH